MYAYYVGVKKYYLIHIIYFFEKNFRTQISANNRLSSTSDSGSVGLVEVTTPTRGNHQFTDGEKVFLKN